MAGKEIVILTQRFDPHADYVIDTLCTMGQEPIRLNTEDIPLESKLWFDLDDARWSGGIEIKTNDRVIDLTNVRSFWWRRPEAFGLPSGLTNREIRFAKGELTHTLASMWLL